MHVGISNIIIIIVVVGMGKITVEMKRNNKNY
jgi:hypothetical protein